MGRADGRLLDEIRSSSLKKGAITWVWQGGESAQGKAPAGQLARKGLSV